MKQLNSNHGWHIFQINIHITLIVKCQIHIHGYIQFYLILVIFIGENINPATFCELRLTWWPGHGYQNRKLMGHNTCAFATAVKCWNSPQGYIFNVWMSTWFWPFEHILSDAYYLIWDPCWNDINYMYIHNPLNSLHHITIQLNLEFDIHSNEAQFWNGC